MKLPILLIAVLLATGCTWVKRAPIPAQCDAMCFVRCKSETRWDADPKDPAAWDVLAGETVPALREETRTCEVRRKACEQCLERLHEQNVIILK